VTHVSQGDISAYFTGTATLEAAEEAVVVARVSGIVQELLVEEGDFIKAGQTLARLDGEKLTIELAQRESNLHKLESDYMRNQELFIKKLVSAEIFESSKFEFLTQKAAFDAAKLDLDYTAIKAPISGVVSERLIKVGNMLPMNQPTFRTTDFEPLLAVMHVPERELQKLHKGQSAKIIVAAIPNTEFSGKIKRISPVVDPTTGTFKVTIEVNDPSKQYSISDKLQSA